MDRLPASSIESVLKRYLLKQLFGVWHIQVLISSVETMVLPPHERHKVRIHGDSALLSEKSIDLVTPPNPPLTSGNPMLANGVTPNPVPSSIAVYIRRAGFDDVPAMRRIYNECVLSSVAVPENDQRYDEDIDMRRKHIESQRLPIFVACLNHSISDHGQSGCDEGVPSTNPVVGFAYADQKPPDKGAYSHTVEAEVFVEQCHRSKKIGTSLLDQLCAVLLSTPPQPGTYAFVGSNDGQGISYRPVRCILIHFSFPTDDQHRLKSSKQWLATLGFSLSAHLTGVGCKLGLMYECCRPR